VRWSTKHGDDVGVPLLGGIVGAWGSLGSGSDVDEGLDVDEVTEAPAPTKTLPQVPPTTVAEVTPVRDANAGVAVGGLVGAVSIQPIPDHEVELWA